MQTNKDNSSVILINPKYLHNVGAAIRACSCFGVKNMLWTGDRVNPIEYERIPREERMKGYRSVRFFQDHRPFDYFKNIPDIVPVCVEVMEESEPLTTFVHPDNALYVFGPEDGGVPQVYRRMCHRFVHIPAHHCLNLSGAVNVVLAHRLIQRQLEGKTELLPLGEMLNEHRGVATPDMERVGWDGK